MVDFNFNYDNFTIFVNGNSALPISYDWKLEKEKIQCPIFNINQLSTNIIEKEGSQLYIRESKNPNSFWKKINHPKISVDHVSQDGLIKYSFHITETDDWVPFISKLKLMWVDQIETSNDFYNKLIIVNNR
jgi:hypothetical protein